MKHCPCGSWRMRTSTTSALERDIETNNNLGGPRKRLWRWFPSNWFHGFIWIFLVILCQCWIWWCGCLFGASLRREIRPELPISKEQMNQFGLPRATMSLVYDFYCLLIFFPLKTTICSLFFVNSNMLADVYCFGNPRNILIAFLKPSLL